MITYLVMAFMVFFGFISFLMNLVLNILITPFIPLFLIFQEIHNVEFPKNEKRETYHFLLTFFVELRSLIDSELEIILNSFSSLVVIYYTSPIVAFKISIMVISTLVFMKMMKKKTPFSADLSCLMTRFNINYINCSLSILGVHKIGCHPITNFGFYSTTQITSLETQDKINILPDPNWYNKEILFRTNSYPLGLNKIIDCQYEIRFFISNSGKRYYEILQCPLYFGKYMFQLSKVIITSGSIDDRIKMDYMLPIIKYMASENACFIKETGEINHSMNLEEIFSFCENNNYILYKLKGDFWVAGFKNFLNYFSRKIPFSNELIVHNELFYGELNLKMILFNLISDNCNYKKKSIKMKTKDKVYCCDVKKIINDKGYSSSNAPYKSRVSKTYHIVKNFNPEELNKNFKRIMSEVLESENLNSNKMLEEIVGMGEEKSNFEFDLDFEVLKSKIEDCSEYTKESLNYNSFDDLEKVSVDKLKNVEVDILSKFKYIINDLNYYKTNEIGFIETLEETSNKEVKLEDFVEEENRLIEERKIKVSQSNWFKRMKSRNENCEVILSRKDLLEIKQEVVQIYKKFVLNNKRVCKFPSLCFCESCSAGRIKETVSNLKFMYCIVGDYIKFEINGSKIRNGVAVNDVENKKDKKASKTNGQFKIYQFDSFKINEEIKRQQRLTEINKKISNRNKTLNKIPNRKSGDLRGKKKIKFFRSELNILHFKFISDIHFKFNKDVYYGKNYCLPFKITPKDFLITRSQIKKIPLKTVKRNKTDIGTSFMQNDNDLNNSVIIKKFLEDFKKHYDFFKKIVGKIKMTKERLKVEKKAECSLDLIDDLINDVFDKLYKEYGKIT